MIEILEVTDKRVEIFTKIRNKSLEEKALIIVESEKVVLKLLKSDIEILNIFAKKDFLDKYQDLLPKNITPFTATNDVMKNIVGSDKHHGVFAQARMPKLVELEQLSKKVLILNSLTSPENVGSIIRTAAAFNINSLIYDSKTVSPYNRRCIRVSMGNIFSMNIHKTNNLLRTIGQLKEKDYQIYSTANIDGSVDIEDVKFNSSSAVIIGSEGHGIDKNILEASNSIIRIPINEYVAHLNAGHASAICLYLLSKS